VPKALAIPLRLSRPATQLAEIMAKVGNCSSTGQPSL
jgi:hypothetical protein